MSETATATAARGTITVWSDVSCPWATAAVHNLLRTRREMGLDDEVALDHRTFPLELLNSQPRPRPVLDAELPVVGTVAPDFGWRLWTGEPWAYPGTVLLALEAVQAAKEQSRRAAEELDLALRRAFFAESRPIGMRHVVLAVAAGCAAVDEAALEEALDGGRGRRRVLADWRAVPGASLLGSPHLFLPDGSGAFNPGVTMHWTGDKPGGFPIIDAFDPSVYTDLLERAR